MYHSKILESSKENFLSNFTKQIGKGAFGEIYQGNNFFKKAKNSFSNQDIAIKVVRKVLNKEKINSDHTLLENENNSLKLLCGEGIRF